MMHPWISIFFLVPCLDLPVEDPSALNEASTDGVAMLERSCSMYV